MSGLSLALTYIDTRGFPGGLRFFHFSFFADFSVFCPNFPLTCSCFMMPVRTRSLDQRMMILLTPGALTKSKKHGAGIGFLSGVPCGTSDKMFQNRPESDMIERHSRFQRTMPAGDSCQAVPEEINAKDQRFACFLRRTGSPDPLR